MQAAVIVDVTRLKKLFHHPDLALTPSPCIEVTVPMLADHDAEGYQRKTRAAKEEVSPFFNETFNFDISPLLVADSSLKTLQLVFRALDTNLSPSAVVGSAQVEVQVGPAIKGDATVTLTGPEGDDRGQLGIRWSVKVVAPAKPIVDADADVVVDSSLVLTGDVPLVPANCQRLWFHLHMNPSFRDRFWKAVIVAVPSGDRPSKAPPAGPRGQRMSTITGGDAGGSEKTMVPVVRDAWKCKRFHQYGTKVRLAASRYLDGQRPTWSAEEELQWKTLWAEYAFLRKQNVAQSSKKIRDQLERAWVLYLTGEVPQDTATLTFDQRTKMSSAVFGRTQYEAIVCCLIEALDANLATGNVAANIAKETFESDSKATGSRAFKEALKAAEEAAARGPSKAADESATPAAAAAKPRPGEAAYELFRSIISAYCDWWCDSFTENEYCLLLSALHPVLLNAKERAEARPLAAAASSSGRRASSTKRRE